jgi:hypothetical protein
MTWAEAARAGRWTEWPGLPSPLSEDTLARELGLGAGARTDTMLGRRNRVLVDTGSARYWLDGADVVLVELIDPPSELPPAELLTALGEPEREGAGRYRKLGASTTEHVFPARGLAVTEARSYDASFDPYVAQVLLFAPTDMAGFILERGGNDRGYPVI